jgi:mannan endo-1,4-beta-mannosidase
VANSLSRRRFLAAAAALGAVPLVPPLSRARRRPQPKPGPWFVTRNGQQTLLNGAPYRFVGFNVWRACKASWATDPATGYNVNDGTTLYDTLAAINASGTRMNCFRAMFLQQYTLNSGATDWSAFDKCLSVAAAAGFKVIACLQDEWNFHGQITKDATWFTSGYSGTTLVNEAVPYRQYVQSVVTRYAGDTTILMWELGNEFDVEAGTGPQAGDVTIMSNFVTDMAGLVKGIDPNHLLSVGVAGNGNAGTIGSDYQTVHAIAGVDMCSFHDYEGATNAGAFEANNGLNTRIPQAAAIGKPLYIGESGIHLTPAPPGGAGGDPVVRAGYLNAKMAAQLAMRGVMGYLPWQFDLRGQGTDDYNYPPADPALTVMGAYC